MNPLQPQDAFGSTHVAALLLLGIDAMARDLLAMTAGVPSEAFAEPDELDFALLGLCALGSHISRFTESTPLGTPTRNTTWLEHDEGVLR